jgi:hypothetical protein
MPYDIQTNALLQYVLIALGYLGILLFPANKRDLYAFRLVAVFCMMLGLRDIDQLSVWADPVLYARVLTIDIPGKDFLTLGGADFVLLFLVNSITHTIFNLKGAFFALHLLYLPPLYLLYRLTRRIEGTFFLLTGWLLFVNSGLLLIANFFRQGQGALYFLVLIMAFSLPVGARWGRRGGALALPLLHLSVAPLVVGLFFCQRRYFYYLFGIFFFLICLAAYVSLTDYDIYGAYIEGSGGYYTMDLWNKVLLTYAIIAVGLYLNGWSKAIIIDDARNIQRTALGFLLPTAVLLIFANTAPQIGTRFIYYSHAIVFLYLTSAIASRKSIWLLGASAVAFSLFGAVTWTYPTVAVLLQW